MLKSGRAVKSTRVLQHNHPNSDERNAALRLGAMGQEATLRPTRLRMANGC